MPLDRILYWKENKPTLEDFGTFLRNFLGNASTPRWTGQKWICSLPGTPTNPLKGLGHLGLERALEPYARVREFEVFWDDDSIDIITRKQDRFTNGVANTLQELCQEIWNVNVLK